MTRKNKLGATPAMLAAAMMGVKPPPSWSSTDDATKDPRKRKGHGGSTKFQSIKDGRQFKRRK